MNETAGKGTALEHELDRCSRSRSSRRRTGSAERALWSRPRDLRGGRRRPRRLVDRPLQGAPRLGRRADRGPRRLRPPLLQMVRGRASERLRPVPRPPRRRRQRRPCRLPLARRGGRAPRRHLRRAPRLDPALRQRPEGPRRREGRRGRDLPADDPRGRGGDAGLRPDRRDPQRRLRRLLRGVGARADGVRRGQGAGHGRRGAAQGQDRADQAAGRRRDGRPGEPRDDRRGALHRDRVPDDRGARRLLRRGLRGGRPRVPGGADGGRAPALHPLHERARPRSRRGSSTPPAAT